MVSRIPTYCSDCGTELGVREIDGRERKVCESCDRVVWRNAVPSVGVAVHDGREVLLIERAAPPVGVWALPGGHPEVDEPPTEAAARELREETGLRVDPVDLGLLDVVHNEFRDRFYVLITYAVERSETWGDLEAGTDAADARFWTLDALEAAGERTRETDRRRIGKAFEQS